MYTHENTDAKATFTKCGEALKRAEKRIEELEAALREAAEFIHQEGNATAHEYADKLEELLST